MCAPRVTRYASIRYSSSCRTGVNMGASIFFTAAVIRAFRSATSRGNGGSFGFLVINVCSLGEHYKTPRINLLIFGLVFLCSCSCDGPINCVVHLVAFFVPCYRYSVLFCIIPCIIGILSQHHRI
jgi:hypothetical protein